MAAIMSSPVHTEYAQPTMAGVRPTSRWRPEDYFFIGMAVLILATVFFGFAHSYFLAGMWNAHLPNRLIHVHGIVFSSWMLLFAAQITLVATGRVHWHRSLGLLGVVLAAAMVILGMAAATDALVRGFTPPNSPFDPKTFYAISFLQVVVFAGLIAAAFWARSNPPAHKRLMLIATISVLGPAINRWPIGLIQKMPPFPVLFIFILMLAGFDLWSRRKIHPATLWAGLTVIISQVLLLPIGQTKAWHSFATWMIHNWTSARF